jgi:2-hydroxychromene-2-carboxylate isomerase
MAIERLLQFVADAHQVIEFIPYWEPDSPTEQELRQRGGEFHYTQMSKAKHLYILQDTKRLADSFGLRMAWPVDINPRWEVPHLSWLKARRLGMSGPFYAGLTTARWQRGENICDLEVIRTVSLSMGLNPDVIAEAVDDAEIRSEAMECLVEAYQDDIFGVPYFRIGMNRFWGLDRLDSFISIFTGKKVSLRQIEDPLLERSIPRTIPHAGDVVAVSDVFDGVPRKLLSEVRGYDTDTPGGCG